MNKTETTDQDQALEYPTKIRLLASSSAKNDKTVEYAFQNIHNPMGVATYQLSSDFPEHLRIVLPDPEALKKLLD